MEKLYYYSITTFFNKQVMVTKYDMDQCLQTEIIMKIPRPI